MKKTFIIIGLLTALLSCEKEDLKPSYENHEFYIRIENSAHNHGLSFDYSVGEYSGHYATREWYRDTFFVLSSGDSININAVCNDNFNITVTVKNVSRNIIFEKTGKKYCDLNVVIP